MNDDGHQLLDAEQRQQRIEFYADHGIGWVARPPHDDSLGGFQRKGKFKKVSNVNFALGVSCSLEDKLNAIERAATWSAVDENREYAVALEETLQEHNGLAWAEGNIRIGDYILLSKFKFLVGICLKRSSSWVWHTQELYAMTVPFVNHDSPVATFVPKIPRMLLELCL